MRIVSINPFRLSVQVISISCTPRAFKSVRTPIQKEELSNLPPHNQEPPSSRSVSVRHKVNGLVYDLTVIPYLEDDTVHPDNKVNRIKGAVLSLHGSLIDFVVMIGMADV